jgi:glycosyltransferase involved in cell wall biosynthesis
MHYSGVLDPSPPQSQIERPLRILHVVGSLGMGGVETWLMQVLRHIDRDRFQMDFLVGTTEPGIYDAEALSLGCQILPCLDIANPWRYAQNFRAILQQQEPYDVIHVHVHYFSGWVLWLAQQQGIPLRIVHSHNDHYQIEQHSPWQRQLYRAGMKALIRHCATHRIATSQQAAVDLWGGQGKTSFSHEILYSGIDLAPFRATVEPVQLRSQLNLPSQAWVIGHAGRFEHQKNHEFIVEVEAEVMRRQPNTYLLLLGEGSLRQPIEDQARSLGIQDHVIFAGVRLDKVALMLGAMDAFLFPSHHEGLGMALVEAQAAGLPCLTSDVVPQEAIVVPELVQQLSLQETASTWATTLLRMVPARVARAAALAQVEASPLNNQHSLQQLTQLYDKARSRRRRTP